MTRSPIARVLFLLLPLTAAAALLALAAPAARSSGPPPPPPPAPGTPFEVVTVFYADAASLLRLRQWKEPWSVDRQAGTLVVDVTAAEKAWLQSLNLRVEVDPARTARYAASRAPLPGQISGIPGYPCYRTVEESYATAAQLAADHPQLAAWLDVGDSWNRLNDGSGGYDLQVLRLTNSDVPGPKPVLFVTGALHAREYATAELVTRFGEMLLAGYGSDADMTWLLDHHAVHLMLQANPDGRKMAENGLLWRKNANATYCSPTPAAWGADLNRNFAFMWNGCGAFGCSSGNPCADTYRGPAPASEPETAAIQAYGATIFDDSRPPDLSVAAPITSSGIFLDVHSYGEQVLWPWGFTPAPAPNGAALQTLGRKLAYFTDYTPMQAVDLYPTDGASDDFFYGTLGVAALTLEIGSEFFQACADFEAAILPDNLDLLLYAARTARAPYLLPAGPDVTSLTLSGAAVPAGPPITLTATLDDARYAAGAGAEPIQPIAAAVYTVDVPPWSINPLPDLHPLDAVDGSFDTSIETSVATVDTTGLAPGRHTIFVRGRDGDGNWGPVSAIFLYIVDPAVAPRIEGFVRDANTGYGLPATITTAGPFATTTDPLTGYYALQVISGTHTLTISSDNFTTATATIPVADAETVQQDFSLDPYCATLVNDGESGVDGWQADFPWGIAADLVFAGGAAWSDSPGGPYANNRDISLTSPPLDLTGRTQTTLTFAHVCDTEAGFDFCTVEARPDAGSAWVRLARWSGPGAAWEQVTLDASLLDNAPAAQIRFRFTSDGAITADGWHVDAIRLLTVGDSCSPTRTFVPLAPVGP